MILMSVIALSFLAPQKSWGQQSDCSCIDPQIGITEAQDCSSYVTLTWECTELVSLYAEVNGSYFEPLSGQSHVPGDFSIYDNQYAIGYLNPGDTLSLQLHRPLTPPPNNTQCVYYSEFIIESPLCSNGIHDDSTEEGEDCGCTCVNGCTPLSEEQCENIEMSLTKVSDPCIGGAGGIEISITNPNDSLTIYGGEVFFDIDITADQNLEMYEILSTSVWIDGGSVENFFFGSYNEIAMNWYSWLSLGGAGGVEIDPGETKTIIVYLNPIDPSFEGEITIGLNGDQAGFCPVDGPNILEGVNESEVIFDFGANPVASHTVSMTSTGYCYSDELKYQHFIGSESPYGVYTASVTGNAHIGGNDTISFPNQTGFSVVIPFPYRGDEELQITNPCGDIILFPLIEVARGSNFGLGLSCPDVRIQIEGLLESNGDSDSTEYIGTGTLELRDASDISNVIGISHVEVYSNTTLLKPLTRFIMEGDAAEAFIVFNFKSHLRVMSSNPVTITNKLITLDFTQNNSYTGDFGQGTGQKQLPTGEWVMLAGDANNDGDINGQDKITWSTFNGTFGSPDLPYQISCADFNLDQDVSGKDRILWERNNGKFTVVPGQ